MGRPATIHYTWGEDRREHVDLTDADGKRAGCLTMARYRTLCGRWDVEQPILAPRGGSQRPLGVCRVCWHEQRRAWFESHRVAEMDVRPRFRHWLKPHPKAIGAQESTP